MKSPSSANLRLSQLAKNLFEQLRPKPSVFAFVGLLAGHMGAIELAAHQLVLAFVALTFTVAVGVASAGSVRVGLAVGARVGRGRAEPDLPRSSVASAG